ncbi:MAG: hypothetical protein KAJ78_04285 [Acidobacteria bacterium]|nr:hypothetical protein [Acidobacteriota bacterium]
MSLIKLQRIVFVFLVSVISVTLLAMEPPQGKGKKPDKPKNEQKEDREDLKDVQEVVGLISALISTDDARRFAGESNLTGRKPLPPGTRKNLAKGKPIPPGIAKEKVPSNYLKKLPSRDGFEWRMAGTDLLLVRSADKVISEVLKDVLK